MFDIISPIRTNNGTYSPTLFEQCHGFFYATFQLMCKDEGDKANGLTSPSNDAIIWTELMVQAGFEPTASRSADQHSSN